MHSHADLTELRISRFCRERLTPAIYRLATPLTITAWEVPDEPVPFADAVARRFEPFAIGSSWGKPWGTVWFHGLGRVPPGWEVGDDTLEVIADLGFTKGLSGFQAEGLVWSPDGRILKALEPMNDYVVLPLGQGDEIDLYIEAAANPDLGSPFIDFTPTKLGRKETAGTASLYTLRRFEVTVRDTNVWELAQDIFTLHGLARELPRESPRRAEIIRALDHVVDAVDPKDVSGTAAVARELLAPVLASPASTSAHRIFAVGHAHIDSAWLWPVRETIRKCARTFSNVLALMDEHPDFIFACSSAQQYAWMKEFYPELFERIRCRVKEGRFVPVGGMWVESDTNMPGGEAMARQFVEGKKFFIAEFGYEPTEAWLPDSFGYSAALPQIVRAAGSSRFLTQKSSWNEVNVMPHHTFEWEGIDGSRVFTHFPPVDTYNSDLSGGDLARAERNYSEKGEANTSLVPFGFGDGGGGPTREMLAAAARTASLEGSPKVRVASPAEFFDEAETEYPAPPVWVGELYLEFHRGAYTSQARTKRGNRRSEHLLHEAELWATTAAIRTESPYPYDVLQKAWQTVLLQQFHDILPGSSIGWVHDQAEANYAHVAESLEFLISSALGELAGGSGETVSFNGSPYTIEGVPAYGAGEAVRASGVALICSATGIEIDNGILHLEIDADGLISSLVDTSTGREIIPAGAKGNLLQLFRDTPTQWDAWDVDKEYQRSGRNLTAVDHVDIVEETTDRVTVRIVRSFGESTVRQVVTLGAERRSVDIVTEVDWREQQKLLKLGFPIDIHADRAASEIQFGHIYRPTHTNTSWDAARFETPAHRWVHVSDSSFGVAIANDSTYGHDVTRHERAGGGTYTIIRQSLLRAPLYPDPIADQGSHVMRSSIVVGEIANAVEEGYRLNLPLRKTSGLPVEALLSSDNSAIVIETVKLADDRSGDVVVRLYEAHGTRAAGTLSASFDYVDVEETDLLERTSALQALTDVDQACVHLTLNPFQLVTLRFAR